MILGGRAFSNFFFCIAMVNIRYGILVGKIDYEHHGQHIIVVLMLLLQ